VIVSVVRGVKCEMLLVVDMGVAFRLGGSQMSPCLPPWSSLGTSTG